MQEIPAMRPPVFLPRIPQSGPGSLRISQRKSWVAVSPVCFFPPTPQPIGNAWTLPPHPPQKRVKIGLFNHITIFSNLRAGSKRPIRWYQNQGGYSDVPLGCKKKSSIAKAFCRLQSIFSLNLLEMLQVVPISGRFYRCKHVSWPESCKARKVKRSDCFLIPRCAELAMTVADFLLLQKLRWGEMCELWIVAVLFLGHCHPLHLQVLVQLIVQGFLQRNSYHIDSHSIFDCLYTLICHCSLVPLGVVPPTKMSISIINIPWFTF